MNAAEKQEYLERQAARDEEKKRRTDKGDKYFGAHFKRQRGFGTWEDKGYTTSTKPAKCIGCRSPMKPYGPCENCNA